MDTHRVYAFTDILAEVNNGKATIIINEPAHLVDITTFQKTPNNNLKKKVQQLKHLISAKTDGTVQLADKDTPLRLGGGFAQIEEPNNNLLLIKRGKDAPRMPDTIDISSGLFDEAWDDPFQMMMGEALEIVRIAGNTMFYPCIIEDKKSPKRSRNNSETLNGKLLNGEVLSINTSMKSAEVWRMLKIERMSTLEDELKQTQGFTSKAALIVSKLGIT